MKNIYVLSIVLCLGCSIGPDYKKPDLELPSTFDTKGSENLSPSLSSENKASLWWKSFNDKRLEQLINIAAVDNLSIQESLARIDQADAIRREAFFDFFPMPDLEGRYIKNKTASARFPGIANNGIQFEIYSANVSMAWEIDIFGRLRRAYEAANNREAETIYNSIHTINSIHSQIATAYFQYLGARRQKEIAFQNTKNQERTLDIVQKKFDVGLVSAFDLERTRAQTMKTKSLLDAYDYLATVSLNRLSALIGKYPTDVPEIFTDNHTNTTLPQYSGEIRMGTPEQLLQRRPDVLAAEERLKAATAEIGVAMGDLYPKISFIGSTGRDARDIQDITSASAVAYNYGPSINWSILNLNAILNRIDASKFNEKALLLNYKNTVVLALEEVDNALKNINQLISKTALLKISAESAKKAQEIATAKYEVGSLNILDLLITQNETLTHESEYVSALVDLDIAYVNLFKALGGAWEDTNKIDESIDKS